LRLIVVEDEPFIALDLESLAVSAGHEVLGVAETLDEAVTLARAQRPEAALVDLNLRDGMTGVEISRRLSGTGVAVGFITGNAEVIPADFAGAVGVVDKPFTPDGVEELLNLLQSKLTGGKTPPPRFARLARP
jgi:two-component system, response regulator PdtaR